MLFDVPARIDNHSAWADQHIASHGAEVHEPSAAGATIGTVG